MLSAQRLQKTVPKYEWLFSRLRFAMEPSGSHEEVQTKGSWPSSPFVGRSSRARPYDTYARCLGNHLAAIRVLFWCHSITRFAPDADLFIHSSRYEALARRGNGHAVNNVPVVLKTTQLLAPGR